MPSICFARAFGPQSIGSYALCETQVFSGLWAPDWLANGKTSRPLRGSSWIESAAAVVAGRLVVSSTSPAEETSTGSVPQRFLKSRSVYKIQYAF
jgi:hypothetical protein